MNDIDELQRLGVSRAALQDRFDNFKRRLLELKLKDAKLFGKYRVNAISWDGDTVSVPYENDGGDIKLFITYKLPEIKEGQPASAIRNPIVGSVDSFDGMSLTSEADHGDAANGTAQGSSVTDVIFPTGSSRIAPILYGHAGTIQVVEWSELQSIMKATQGNHTRGVYYEYYEVRQLNNQTVIYIANAPAKLSEFIERYNVWKKRKELSDFLFPSAQRPGLAVNIHLDPEFREQLILRVVTEANRILLGNQMRLAAPASEDDVLEVFFINTQRRFEGQTQAFLSGSDRYSVDHYYVNADDYDHVRHFSWIYQKEIEGLLDLLRRNPERQVVVTDLGTGFGNFILTCAKVLSPADLRRIRFIGTDHKLKDLRFAMAAANNYPGLNVEWRQDDINTSTSTAYKQEYSDGQYVGLTVVNHVLEHLDAKTPAEYILDWLCVAHGTLLAVTVPLDDNLDNTVSSHTDNFTEKKLIALGKEIEEKTHGTVRFDPSYVRGGMLLFQWTDEAAVVRESARRFGWDAVGDICRVYSTVWGRDAYRLKGQPMQGTSISSFDILTALNEIASVDGIGQQIALELAQALRYTQGVTDASNLMRPISPETLRDVAGRWRKNRSVVDVAATEQELPLSSMEPFKRIYAEWTTYLGLIEHARGITGRADPDSYDGLGREIIKAAVKGQPRRLRQSIIQNIARRAHEEYEKADLVGLKTAHTLMRIKPLLIQSLLREGKWERLLEWAVLASLHGEGKFYQALQIHLELLTSKDVRESFQDLVRLYIDALSSGYRTGRPLEQVDIKKLDNSTRDFLSAAGKVEIPQGFDFDRALIKKRQARMREAESYLEDVEHAFAGKVEKSVAAGGSPTDAYKESMLDFLDGLERISQASGDAQALLNQYRDRLIRARALSDSTYAHDYFYWTGAREHIDQMKSRAHHPRYQLYQMEAYAERIFFSGMLAIQDLAGGKIRPAQLNETYKRYFNFDERTLYAQEWIANYGPRRPALFGREPVDTIPENEATLSRDIWIRKTCSKLIAAGADPELWGPIMTGYTEELRHLVTEGDDVSGAVIQNLETLAEQLNIEGFASAVRNTNPYDVPGLIGKKPPLVTTGVHIHNVDPAVSFETFVHMREVDWPAAASWRAIGTTTSVRATAEKEHRMALELGLTRLGITNRQLLKAGNQNRVILNAPMESGRESFYLTLDDDYVVSPPALRQMVPLLLEHPYIAFVQSPLFFRAVLEPGHSIGRRADAVAIQSWAESFGMAINELDANRAKSANIFEQSTARKPRASVSLPSGTGTLYRTTYGKNSIVATGGFVADPTTVMSGEDFAHGAMATLMRTHPERFERVQGRWEDGIFLSKVLVIGDGVDYMPGGVRQKMRWTLSGVSILKRIWLPSISLRTKFRKDDTLTWKSFIAMTNIFSGLGIYAVVGAFALLVFPILPFTPLVANYTGYWGLASTLVQWVAIPVLILHYLQKLTLREIIDTCVMFYFGTYWSYLRGTAKALWSPPGEDQIWYAHKGREISGSLVVISAAMGLFYVISAFAGIYQGAPVFALNLLFAAGFIALCRFQETSPKNQREKIEKMARDAKETYWKKVNRHMVYRRTTLGLPVDRRHARPILFLWSGIIAANLTAMAVHIVPGIFSRPLYISIALAGFVALSVVFAMTYTISIWIIVRGIENRALEDVHMPTVKPHELIRRIQQYSAVPKLSPASSVSSGKNAFLTSLLSKPAAQPQPVSPAVPPANSLRHVQASVATPVMADVDLEHEKQVAVAFKDTILIRCRDAYKNGETLILGFDTSWIVNMAAAQPIISELKRLPERLKRLGFNNVIFKVGHGNELALELAREKDALHSKFSNIIVIGSASIIEENESNEFNKLRNDALNDRAILIGVNPENLTPYTGARILEMWLLALELHMGKLPARLNKEYFNISVMKDDQGRARAFLFTPIKPYDFERIREINRIQIEHVRTKA